jgi:hypothetical protein
VIQWLPCNALSWCLVTKPCLVCREINRLKCTSSFRYSKWTGLSWPATWAPLLLRLKVVILYKLPTHNTQNVWGTSRLKGRGEINQYVYDTKGFKLFRKMSLCLTYFSMDEALKHSNKVTWCQRTHFLQDPLAATKQKSTTLIEL